ncbi:MAG: glycosyl hydrolase 115 family protein [Chitinophagaceae bacterium]|nr:glycosyl hydrolase 115 family protein [Chitinophagaceae bacterium]
MLHKYFILSLFCLFFWQRSSAQTLLTKQPVINGIALKQMAICVDEHDDPTVLLAVRLLQQDMEAVFGKKPLLYHRLSQAKGNVIIVGSIAKSEFIKELSTAKKINTKSIFGKWEGYLLQTIAAPVSNIQNALVIAGSDRRGTAFGVLELSKQMGVSPWYWWADVTVQHQDDLYLYHGVKVIDTPKVRYRGIFINDEAPALSSWSKEKFGGFNHQFYSHVFELMLRLKANYLWPAMWGNAFYDDDSLNIKVADEYGIVIGTSHHEPLMRAHDEWRRYGKGKKWNYDSTEADLKDFWRKGVQRAWNEKIITLGMRGDGDEPMSRETATALLEKIVADQREIIADVSGKPAKQTPQLWALYKEVQDYYDQGMRVPDDVTLLLCDDNWGNIRRLPSINEKQRAGGYGIYYHFDYVGGPRNYKWINTNHITRIWEQMHLAWVYNARQIWIVNVGDIKPMEFPISFFLDYAWNPDAIGADDLQQYTCNWSAAQFGKSQALEIGALIDGYTKMNSLRKPELLDENTFSFHYNEWERMVSNYNSLLKQAEQVHHLIAPSLRDAYYQLVLHPIKASENLYQLYYAVARNKQSAKLNDVKANGYATEAKRRFENDSLITEEYHHLKNGKWKHMMSQTHIGYTYWQQPPVNKMPFVETVLEGSVPVSLAKPNDLNVRKANVPADVRGRAFYEKDGVVSIQADHFSRSASPKGVSWKVLPNHGRVGNAITTFPVTHASFSIAPAPTVEYEFYTYDTGNLRLNTYLSPSLNYWHLPEGLQIAVSINNEAPQIISINKDDAVTKTWEKWVANNIIVKQTQHRVEKAGKQVVKLKVLHPGIVVQQLVLDFGGLKSSFLGPPETINN